MILLVPSICYASKFVGHCFKPAIHATMLTQWVVLFFFNNLLLLLLHRCKTLLLFIDVGRCRLQLSSSIRDVHEVQQKVMQISELIDRSNKYNAESGSGAQVEHLLNYFCFNFRTSLVQALSLQTKYLDISKFVSLRPLLIHCTAPCFLKFKNCFFLLPVI